MANDLESTLKGIFDTHYSDFYTLNLDGQADILIGTRGRNKPSYAICIRYSSSEMCEDGSPKVYDSVSDAIDGIVGIISEHFDWSYEDALEWLGNQFNEEDEEE